MMMMVMVVVVVVMMRCRCIYNLERQMHAVIMMPNVVEMILNIMRPTVTPIRVFSSAQHTTASTTVIQRRMHRLMFALMGMSAAGFRNGQTGQTSGVHILFFS